MALDTTALTVSEAHSFREVSLSSGTASFMRHDGGRWTMALACIGHAATGISVTHHLTDADLAALGAALTALVQQQKEAA